MRPAQQGGLCHLLPSRPGRVHLLVLGAAEELREARLVALCRVLEAGGRSGFDTLFILCVQLPYARAWLDGRVVKIVGQAVRGDALQLSTTLLVVLAEA